jgi:hypothetical protein
MRAVLAPASWQFEAGGEVSPFNIIGINVRELSVTVQSETVVLVDAICVCVHRKLLQIHVSTK